MGELPPEVKNRISHRSRATKKLLDLLKDQFSPEWTTGGESVVRVLIVSDSHGEGALLREVVDREQADHVIHCGDFCTESAQLPGAGSRWSGGIATGWKFLGKHGGKAGASTS